MNFAVHNQVEVTLWLSEKKCSVFYCIPQLRDKITNLLRMMVHLQQMCEVLLDPPGVSQRMWPKPPLGPHQWLAPRTRFLPLTHTLHPADCEDLISEGIHMAVQYISFLNSHLIDLRGYMWRSEKLFGPSPSLKGDKILALHQEERRRHRGGQKKHTKMKELGTVKELNGTDFKSS